MAQYDGSIRINTKIDSKEASAQLMTLENRIVKTADKVASLRSKMDALKGVQIPTQEYAEIQKQIEATEKKITDLVSRQEKFLETGGKESSSAYKKMQYDLEELRNSLPYLQGELQDLVDTGKSFTLGEDSQEFANLGQQLQYAESDLEALTQRHDELIAKQGSASSGFQKLGQVAKNAFSKIANIVKGSAVKSFEFLGSAIKKTTSLMFGFGKSTKSSGNSLQMGLKNILKYGLGIRSLYALVNKLRTAIKDGFSNMANEVDGFKSHVDGLKASTLTLKNSLAAAFSPLVEVALPYIQMVVDAMAKLLDTVGQFMAAITGQKTYTKAIKQTTAAIEEENKAQNKQLSGLDKLNNLSSGSGGDSGAGAGEMFEEEVPISNPILDMYENIKNLIENEDWEGLGAYIADALNRGLHKIYDVINWNNVEPYVTAFIDAFSGTVNGLVDKFDWDLLGRTIGAGINTFANTFNQLIDKVNFENLGSKLSVGLRGAIEEIDWQNLGNLIGNKFMVAWRIAEGLINGMWKINPDTLMTGWEELGVALGNALNGIVEKIDLSRIGATLGKALTGIFQTAISFAATFDWKALGTNIYQGINSFFANTDWSIVGKGFSDIVTGLFYALLVSIQGIDWKQIGTSVGTFLANIDWGTIIYDALVLLFEIPRIICNTLSGAIQAIDWGQLVTDIATAIKDFFMNYDWEGWFYSVGEFVGSIFAAVFDIAGVLGEYIMQAVDSLKEYFLGYIIESLSGLDEDANLFEIGWAIIQGVFNGILDTIANIGNWIVEHIVNPFLDGFRNAFGIHSPSTVMEEMGVFLMEGLFNGISSLVDKVVSIFTDIKDKISEKWDAIKEATSETWENIKRSLSDTWENLKGYAAEKFENMRNGIAEKWDSVKSNTENTWRNIKSSLSGSWDSIKGYASVKFENMRSVISDKWNSVKSNTRNTWDNIKSSLSSSWESLKGNARLSFDRIRESIGNSWNNVKSNTTNSWSQIRSSVLEIWNKLKSNLMDSVNKTKDGIIRVWDNLKSGTSKVWDSMATMIKRPINAILAAVESLANGIINGINAGISALNKLSFSVPDWVPSIGGKSFGFSLDTLSNVSIPRLATGAVIPANKEFLAVLGDQKNGRNLETPEDLLRKIVREESGNGEGGLKEITIRVPVEVDSMVLFEIIKKLDFEQFKRTGRPSFQM